MSRTVLIIFILVMVAMAAMNLLLLSENRDLRGQIHRSTVAIEGLIEADARLKAACDEIEARLPRK